MFAKNSAPSWLLANASVLAMLTGCPADDAPEGMDTGGESASDTEPTTSTTAATATGSDTDPVETTSATEAPTTGEVVLPEGCDFFVEPGEMAQEQLITALVDVAPDQTVCLGAGEFSFTRQLTVTEDSVTIRGEGAEATILDFSEQQSGGNGILIEGDNNLVEGITVLETPGDGIRANDVDGITFRGVTVGWSGEALETNGAYALYPVQSSNVTIQDCIVYGAADAGVYLGQSTNSLIENSEAYGNVIGIEVENSTDTIVRNCHAHDNTNGILVITLPGLDILDGKRANVYDNLVEDNNLPNFGDPGTSVGILPEGVGILLVATDSNEIWNNEIRGNISGAVGIVGFVEALFGAPNDPMFDVYSQSNYVHDNVIENNATMPATIVGALTEGQNVEVISDGCFDAELDNSDDSLTNCLQIGDSSFIDADLCMQIGGSTNDLDAYDCTHPSLSTDSPVQD